MRAATTKTAPTKSIQARTGTAAPAIIMVITKGIIHIIITMEAVTGITAATEAGTAAVTVDMEAAIPAVEILAAAILAVAETNS